MKKLNLINLSKNTIEKGKLKFLKGGSGCDCHCGCYCSPTERSLSANASADGNYGSTYTMNHG